LVEATLDYLRQGGWVMLPLVGVSLVMWTLLVERWRSLRELRVGDLDAAGVLAVARGERNASDACGLRARLADDFAVARTGRPPLDREILAHIALRIDGVLDRRLAIIAVLAAVAPLLGLLGTVLGMIETFQVISDYGTGNARALAGGISVALVTTQTGLLVAIPGLLASARLRRIAEELRQRLAETTQMIDRDLARLAGPRKTKRRRDRDQH
jgi:biopolymer transport protein ExbB